MLYLSKPHIEYEIITDERGACLSIREPAPLTQIRVKPYRFSLNYRFASEQEAREMLDRYLRTCGTETLESNEFSRDRQPQILQSLQRIFPRFSTGLVSKA